MNTPMPARPAWVNSTPPSLRLGAARHTPLSNTSATAAAVPTAARRVVITPDINTGNTSRAPKFRLAPGSNRCSAANTSRSTPIVASHWRRPRRVITGASPGRTCGNIHSVMLWAA